MTPRLTSYIPCQPTAKQAAFLLLPHLEAFFGGQPGGGKSQALLMAALQYVDVPGYAAILFRRTYADLALPGALMDRSKEWLMNTDARWNEQRKTWTFPSGATLSFGYLESENDKFRYQGAEFQFIGMDEASQISEMQYLYLFSRLRRRVGVEVPLRMRCASNPPASAIGQWVKERFVINRSKERPFVPSGLDDNPHLDKVEYLRSLASLDRATYASLFDWFAAVEGLVYSDFGQENLTDMEPDPERPIELAIDDGYVDPRATLFMQRMPNGDLLVFDELYQTKTLEEATVADIVRRCEERGWPLPEMAAVSHEAPALRTRLRKVDIPARNWLAAKVGGGERSTRVAAIKATRALLCDSQGHRAIRIHPRCSNLIWEITQGYRYPEGRKSGPDDMPEDGNDHACNALESYIWLRMRKG